MLERPELPSSQASEVAETGNWSWKAGGWVPALRFLQEAAGNSRGVRWGLAAGDWEVATRVFHRARPPHSFREPEMMSGSCLPPGSRCLDLRHRSKKGEPGCQTRRICDVQVTCPGTQPTPALAGAKRPGPIGGSVAQAPPTGPGLSSAGPTPRPVCQAWRAEVGVAGAAGCRRDFRRAVASSGRAVGFRAASGHEGELWAAASPRLLWMLRLSRLGVGALSGEAQRRT